jgi:UDP-N-acetylmuramoyl-L-alanyl-D-glutamate--2,6-diaminopimelate ligase
VEKQGEIYFALQEVLMKTLKEIFADIPVKVLAGEPDGTEVGRVVADSREVKPGDLFVATRGEHFDAHRFIPQAVAQGAAAVVGMDPGLVLAVPYIRVENSRQALAHLAAAIHDFPARKLTVIGVTGTDGKTTTCNLLYQILLAAGLKSGMITTVNAVIGDQVLDTGFHVTTPDAVDMQAYLEQMVGAGLTHAILETTSHGWAQYRVDGCEIDIGVVTNITHEHLDEHGSYKNYRAAKARLFESLGETRLKPQGNPRLAVLNADDVSFEYLKSKIATQWVSYGIEKPAGVTGLDIVHEPGGMRFRAVGADWEATLFSHLAGSYNVSNILAAATAAVVGLGIDPGMVEAGVRNLGGIPGRMERIDMGQNFSAFVDFAHTPNALKNALASAREMTQGRVIAVFGSAGLRDREKRRMMAEISAKMADLTVLTAEDPRTESLEGILAEMASGAARAGGVEGETFWRVPDRGDAIRFGLRLAQAGDLVLACGKGHEQSMCFGQTEVPWDDRTAMRAALAEYLGVNGPQMPNLPTNT